MRSIATSDLSVGWNGKPVVSHVDFEVTSGQVLAIAGPNGAGKSTILKSVARLLRPLSGRILLDGTDVWQLKSKEFAGKVAYVSQGLEIGQSLTVQELVALGRNPHQDWWSWSSSSADREAICQALERTGTWELRHKFLSSLSGGERQRAIIASALAQQPQYMILDEPTAHLDFRHQLELVDLLKDLRARGLGILIVLHDLNLLARLADRIAMIEKPPDGPGLVAGLGAPAEVLNPDLLRRVYHVEVSILRDPATGEPVYTAAACAD